METFKPKFTGMNFHNMDGTGWPDSVVVDNGGSVLKGTYESMTYMPERTCKVVRRDRDEYGEFAEYSCGHVNVWQSWNEPSFCCWCGAKAVE